jgi:probable F420-dependent oxidoreductase
MKIGIFVFVTDIGIGPVQAAQAAEAAGLDAIWTGDHSHIPRENDTVDGLDQLPIFITCYARFVDTVVALTAMATATERITIGSGVILVPMREPLTLAKQIASIDHLSGGRLQFGIGGGWNHQEMRNHGIDPGNRFARMREYVLAMQQIWTEEAAGFEGRFVNFTGVMSWPKPVQRPWPPILVGGRGPKVLERVFEYGDGWAPDLEGGIEQIEAQAERVEEFKRRRAESGRSEMLLVAAGVSIDQACLDRCVELGFDQVILEAPAGSEVENLASIQEAGELASRYRDASLAAAR